MCVCVCVRACVHAHMMMCVFMHVCSTGRGLADGNQTERWTEGSLPRKLHQALQPVNHHHRRQKHTRTVQGRRTVKQFEQCSAGCCNDRDNTVEWDVRAS